MEFGFSAAEEEFRARIRGELRGPEVRAALADLPDDNVGGPELRRLHLVLGERNLLAPHWPVEYGGLGLPFNLGGIVTEELVRAGVPETLHISTVQIVGQFLLVIGNHEHKLRHLPPIARGEHFVSVLYTEPDTGCDIGSLTTVAEPDGDGFRLTGTKVFSLKTQMADYSLTAARTGEGDTRYAGITLFMVDMTTPGIRVSPIPTIWDEPFYRVDLDGAFVPSDCVLGRPGEGWALLSKGLPIERNGLDYYLKAERWFGTALGCLAEQYPDPGAADDGLLELIGRNCASLRASHLLAWDVLGGIKAGKVDETAAAVARYHAGELAGSIARWAGSVPTAAQRSAGGQAAVLEEGYLEAPGVTLSAGTSEMMLQLIAAALDRAGQES
ncbi:MAG TPA: acyl-CoA dehydrogenase family protein [Streptosporangiaceae bacterium]|jgi:alkylation response protein AidB-like acyl-CoA dehydrogenase|nr:acyl-CoA dehydrogenase family protein [Streptosporangiaceae bacterium]